MPVDPRYPTEPTRSPTDDPILGTGPTADPTTGGDTSLPNTGPNTSFDEQLQAQLQAYLAAQGTSSKPTNPEIVSAGATYFKIWGVQPPKGYIEGLIKDGMNVFEIAAHEMAKPAFRNTRAYRDQYGSYAEVIARIFGRR